MLTSEAVSPPPARSAPPEEGTITAPCERVFSHRTEEPEDAITIAEVRGLRAEEERSRRSGPAITADGLHSLFENMTDARRTAFRNCLYTYHD